MTFKSSWVRFPPAHPKECQGGTEKSVPPFPSPKRQHAPTSFAGSPGGVAQGFAEAGQPEHPEKGARFFSRGRPTFQLFASETNFFQNLPQRGVKRGTMGTWRMFKRWWAAGLPPASGNQPLSRAFGHDRCILCKNRKHVTSPGAAHPDHSDRAVKTIAIIRYKKL